MTTETIEVRASPSDEALISPAQRMLDSARSLVIDSPEMEQVAADELGRIKRRYRELEDERLEITRDIDAAKKKIMDKYRTPLDYLSQAESAIKRSIGAYRKVLEDRRREQQRLADEEARRVREKLENEARAAREKAEREAAETRRKAEEAAAAGRAAEAERLAAKADSKLAAGDAKADSLMQAAAAAPTSVIVPSVPKASGVHTVTRYSAKVTNKAALVAFIAQTPMFLHLLDANQSALDAQARALKDQFAIPGVELVRTETVSARAA